MFFFFNLLLLGMLFLFTATFLILTESPVHSILYLMFMFLYLTQLTILFKFEFLGLIFIIVYIGAVCVLMLFHIKFIKTFSNRFDILNDKELFLPLISLIYFLPILELLVLIWSSFIYSENIEYLNFNEISEINFNYISWIDLYENFNNTQILGFLIYNIYFIYLILGSFILFVAMVGSIYLTLIFYKKKKYQNISKQILKNINFFKLNNNIEKNNK